MTTHASHIYVHGTPRILRRRRVRRNRLLVAFAVPVIMLASYDLWPRGSSSSAAASALQVPVDEHAPTGSDSLDGLTERMRGSVRAAMEAASADGVRIEIVSAARSSSEQQVLFDQAIARYGSESVARQWVLPPDESEHVTGGAIDVQPREAAQWLEKHGVKYGLCRRYVNEWWHFERLAGPRGATCPPMEANAAS